MARFVDWSSGNRTIYDRKSKDHPLIIYFDIEPELTWTPDRIVDSRNSGLSDSCVDDNVWDPPHEVGRTKNSTVFTTPNTEIVNDRYGYNRNVHSYYGADKYASKEDLLGYIVDTQKEINRVTKNTGILFFKWSENLFTLKKILEYLDCWTPIIKIKVKPESEKSTKTWWVLMMKSIE